MTEKDNDISDDVLKPLVLDLIGPFVVYFTGGRVKIHVPLCAEHHANILTDSNDIALPGSLLTPRPAGGYKEGFVYHLEGPIGCDDKCKCNNPDLLLIVTPKPGPIVAEKCHLVLNVPNPNTMVPLLPDKVWMHRNGATSWVNANSEIVIGNRARSLRLIYSDCLGKPKITLVKQPQSPNPFKRDFTPDNSDALGLDPPYYHITLRFVSSATSPDQHHEDAYNCFQEMRTLVPDAEKWRVDFDDSADLSQVEMVLLRRGGPMPVDCGAMVMVVQE